MPISVHDDFFQKSLIDHCAHYSLKMTQARGRMMFTSLAWGEEVRHDSPPVLIHPLPQEHTLTNQITEVLDAKLGLRPKANQILFYYWPTHSYIPWHNDPSVKAGITIYLNKQWSRDHGGLFLYEEHDTIRGIVPKYNTCVVQQGGVLHSTTPVLPKGKLRCTLQIWID